MQNKILVYVGIALLVGVVGGYLFNQSKTNNNGTTVSQTGSFGYGNGIGQGQVSQPNKDNCLADDCLLVEDLEYPVGELSSQVQEALDKAIEDEYKALATYEAVVAKFGTARPFSMIIGAEEQHIASLKAIYDKYGLEAPSSATGNVSVPATLQEACQVGVGAEIANAALYEEELLPAVKEYEDITLVFENLMNASLEKHLPAFENCN